MVIQPNGHFNTVDVTFLSVVWHGRLAIQFISLRAATEIAEMTIAVLPTNYSNAMFCLFWKGLGFLVLSRYPTFLDDNGHNHLKRETRKLQDIDLSELKINHIGWQNFSIEIKSNKRMYYDYRYRHQYVTSFDEKYHSDVTKTLNAKTTLSDLTLCLLIAVWRSAVITVRETDVLFTKWVWLR